MLGFFPDSYPDELFYSCCARYSFRTKYPSKYTAATELFRNTLAPAIVDLPTRLDDLISRFPPGHTYTSDAIIDNHTLLPLYAPFLPHKRLMDAKNDMRGSGGNHVRSRLGLTTDRMDRSKHLRFCPACVKEDREAFGETYWHRIHQITGVEVCPYHAVFLESNTACRLGWPNVNVFIAAEPIVPDVYARQLNLTAPHHSIQFKIAKDCAWLLSQQGLVINESELRKRYLKLLLKHGYAYHSGRIRATKLFDDFINFYSVRILNNLQCPITSKTDNWLLRLLLINREVSVKHPLRHLLLMTFLGYSAEQVFTLYEEYKPFGDGPWPCLNRASNHFEQLRVRSCRIVSSPVEGKATRLMGVFSCHCGFVYTRTSTILGEEEQYQISSVQSYGQVWEEALRELWDDTSITLYQISKELGVNQLTAKRHAIRLGLSYPRGTPQSKRASGKLLKRYVMTRHLTQSSLEYRRSKWLNVRESNPDAGRWELRNMAHSLYLWLQRSDADWFNSHLPPVRTPAPRAKRIDWKSIDVKLAAAVEATAKRIRGMPGRPARISIAATMREVGHKSWLECYLHKLPITSQVLKNYLESPEDFLIRRVKWAEGWFSQKGTCPTRHYFEVQAGTRNMAGRAPAVQGAINAAMERLSKGLR